MAAMTTVSELLEEHRDAGELHKAEEIAGVILPAYEEPPFPLQPGKVTFPRFHGHLYKGEQDEIGGQHDHHDTTAIHGRI